MKKETKRKRRFMRYKEACEAYCLGKNKMHNLALEAGAIYKIDRAVLIDVEALDQHLESYYKLV